MPKGLPSLWMKLGHRMWLVIIILGVIFMAGYLLG
jgi:hypothetical protein